MKEIHMWDHYPPDFRVQYYYPWNTYLRGMGKYKLIFSISSKNVYNENNKPILKI